jgi:predicted NACHT family NTPase
MKFNRIGFADNIIDRMLESDNFLFFFDGYDEVNSTKKSGVSHEIDAFVTRYSQNCYMLTSRPNTNVELLSTFKNYFVCDLQLNEIKDFVKKQIPREEGELTAKIITAIDKTENHNYRSFLSNPLLLSMFILTFQTYSAIPQRRSEFYNQVFNALFSIYGREAQ